MKSPNSSPELSFNAGTTVLDTYFEEAAKGTEHRKRIAMLVWDTLTPEQRLQHQVNAYNLTGSDLATGAAYTQSVLLLEYVNQMAIDNAYGSPPRN